MSLTSLTTARRPLRTAFAVAALGFAMTGAFAAPASATPGASPSQAVEHRPCDGCVGNADDKTPAGQTLDGSDPNAGYECDTNHGVGRGNPAHSTCSTEPPGGGGTL